MPFPSAVGFNFGSSSAGYADWQDRVRRFYHQLMVGCCDPSCQQPFCATAHRVNRPTEPPLPAGMAQMLALCLAAHPGNQFLCEGFIDSDDWLTPPLSPNKSWSATSTEQDFGESRRRKSTREPRRKHKGTRAWHTSKRMSSNAVEGSILNQMVAALNSRLPAWMQRWVERTPLLAAYLGTGKGEWYIHKWALVDSDEPMKRPRGLGVLPCTFTDALLQTRSLKALFPQDSPLSATHSGDCSNSSSSPLNLPFSSPTAECDSSVQYYTPYLTYLNPVVLDLLLRDISRVDSPYSCSSRPLNFPWLLRTSKRSHSVVPLPFSGPNSQGQTALHYGASERVGIVQDDSPNPDNPSMQYRARAQSVPDTDSVSRANVLDTPNLMISGFDPFSVNTLRSYMHNGDGHSAGNSPTAAPQHEQGRVSPCIYPMVADSTVSPVMLDPATQSLRSSPQRVPSPITTAFLPLMSPGVRGPVLTNRDDMERLLRQASINSPSYDTQFSGGERKRVMDLQPVKDAYYTTGILGSPSDSILSLGRDNLSVTEVLARTIKYIFSDPTRLVHGLANWNSPDYPMDPTSVEDASPISFKLEVDIEAVRKVFELLGEIHTPELVRVTVDTLHTLLAEMARVGERLAARPVIVQVPPTGERKSRLELALNFIRALVILWENPLFVAGDVGGYDIQSEIHLDHWDLFQSLISLTVGCKRIQFCGQLPDYTGVTKTTVTGLELYGLWLCQRGSQAPQPPGLASLPMQARMDYTSIPDLEAAMSWTTSFRRNSVKQSASPVVMVPRARVRILKSLLFARIRPFVPNQTHTIDTDTRDVMELLGVWWVIFCRPFLQGQLGKACYLPTLQSLSEVIGEYCTKFPDQLPDRQPCSRYVLPRLCNFLNFRLEVQNWRIMHHRNEAQRYKHTKRYQNPKAEFSLLDYPYLFTQETKALIVREDSLKEMTMHYERGIFNNMYINQLRLYLNEKDFRHPCFQVESGAPPGMAPAMYLNDSAKPYLLVEVHREHLVEESLQQLALQFRHLRQPLKVRFLNDGEVGVDQGGVQKEWFRTLVAKLFSDYRPFAECWTEDTDTRTFWPKADILGMDAADPNNQSPDGLGKEANSGKNQTQPQFLTLFEYFGVILGLAFYNNVHLPLPLPKAFFIKLLGDNVQASELASTSPRLMRGLQTLLDWNDPDVDVTEAFGLTFEITALDIAQPDHRPVTIPLLAQNGGRTDVTQSNRRQYVELYADFVLNRLVTRAFDAIRRGFGRVVHPDLLGLCSHLDLYALMVGTQEWELDELQRVTTYEDQYHANHPFIKKFWQVVHSFSEEQKRQLLLFVTANDHLPVGGIQALTFVVQRNGPDSERFPTALTCFGRLLLPEYNSKAKLREKLLNAIQNTEGFGLV
ncbi:hypothetical protein IWQ62_003228 [Dispira parvispora]|uniref:HECT-type E3 ubiquitin transferase n=1 Tax=Dispira parvispora TaxID=1520584 RepID=A0A9W8AUJ9_9FUNG|nr:hypothetical protein IWQ62_003228 [Dispira parvispora]